MDHEESAGLGPFTLPVWLVRTPGPTGTFTPCSRGGSGAVNTRRRPGCLRKQNRRTNSAAGPTPPRGRSGHFNATGWPGRFSEEGTYRPARMLIQASRSRLAAMHYPASARRQHSPSRGLSPAGLRTRGSAGIISRTWASRMSAHAAVRACWRLGRRAVLIWPAGRGGGGTRGEAGSCRPVREAGQGGQGRRRRR